MRAPAVRGAGRVARLAPYTFRMRLTNAERAAICETVRSVAGPTTRVRLFGSRTDDLARGGDIDLLVEVDHPVQSTVHLGTRIGARLQQALGERRIDVMMAAPNVAEGTIHRVARETKIEL
jgi:predicted nucleotidyltransferase